MVSVLIKKAVIFYYNLNFIKKFMIPFFVIKFAVDFLINHSLMFIEQTLVLTQCSMNSSTGKKVFH